MIDLLWMATVLRFLVKCIVYSSVDDIQTCANSGEMKFIRTCIALRTLSLLSYIFRARGFLQEEKTMQSAIHGGFLCLLDLIAQLFHYW